jgi:hypothetical protein
MVVLVHIFVTTGANPSMQRSADQGEASERPGRLNGARIVWRPPPVTRKGPRESPSQAAPAGVSSLIVRDGDEGKPVGLIVVGQTFISAHLMGRTIPVKPRFFPSIEVDAININAG